MVWKVLIAWKIEAVSLNSIGGHHTGINHFMCDTFDANNSRFGNKEYREM
jgi:hypothetical protein